MKDLTDKVVVITGAGSGIGREMALKFAAENSRLALSDINKTGLAETLTQLNLDKKRVATFIVDASDRDAKLMQLMKRISPKATLRLITRHYASLLDRY